MKAVAHPKSIYPGWWVALGSSLSLGVVLCAMAAAVLLLTLGVSLPLLVVFALLWGVGDGIGPALESLLVGRALACASRSRPAGGRRSTRPRRARSGWRR
jgi:hypothetical protein